MSLKQFQEKSLNCEGNVRINFFLGIVTKSELCYAKLCIEMFTLIFLHTVSYKTITIFSVKLYSKVPSGNISSGKKSELREKSVM